MLVPKDLRDLQEVLDLVVTEDLGVKLDLKVQEVLLDPRDLLEAKALKAL